MVHPIGCARRPGSGCDHLPVCGRRRGSGPARAPADPVLVGGRRPGRVVRVRVHPAGARARVAAPEVTFAVVGDSLTAGLGRTRCDGTRVRGSELLGAGSGRGPGSPHRWLGGAGRPDRGHAGRRPSRCRPTCSWSWPGPTTSTGTVPWATSRANLLAIVDEAGIDEVLVVAVPPLDSRPVVAAGYDYRLADLAAERGLASTSIPGAGSPTAADGARCQSRRGPPHPGGGRRSGALIRAALLDRAARGARSAD